MLDGRYSAYKSAVYTRFLVLQLVERYVMVLPPVLALRPRNRRGFTAGTSTEQDLMHIHISQLN